MLDRLADGSGFRVEAEEVEAFGASGVGVGAGVEQLRAGSWEGAGAAPEANGADCAHGDELSAGEGVVELHRCFSWLAVPEDNRRVGGASSRSCTVRRMARDDGGGAAVWRRIGEVGSFWRVGAVILQVSCRETGAG